MSSADLFAQSGRMREQAVATRHKAELLNRAVEQVREAPGKATATLSFSAWAGPKATATEQLMHDSFNVLRYAADLTTADINDLLNEARNLDAEADQLAGEARRLAFLEAEAEAARLRAIAAAERASQAANAAAAAASKASTTATSASPKPTTTAAPTLTFAPIQTTPVESAIPVPAQSPEPTNEDAPPSSAF